MFDNKYKAILSTFPQRLYLTQPEKTNLKLHCQLLPQFLKNFMEAAPTDLGIMVCGSSCSLTVRQKGLAYTMYKCEMVSQAGRVEKCGLGSEN